MKFLDARKKTEDTILLPINQLYPMVSVINQDFKELVKQSIEQKGLEYPLIVFRLTPYQWANEKATTNPDINDHPANVHIMDWVYRVQCGNNRLEAAKELGYTHIDCRLFYNIEQTHGLCNEQRKQKEWRNIE